MSIVKLNNKAVSNATVIGSISSLGSMTFIKKLTASQLLLLYLLLMVQMVWC
jgi:hypothetical protein